MNSSCGAMSRPRGLKATGISRRALLGGMTVSMLPILGGCSIFSTSAIRYRMVVELNTPWGVRRGSSVVESFMRDGPRIGDSGGVSNELRGEAVTIALPGGTFFALLGRLGQGDSSDYFAHILSRALARQESQPPLSRKYRGGEWKAERAEALQKRAKVILNESNYPTFATFEDLRDPNTVREVTPENIGDIFGSGVSIRQVSLQATTDKITSGIRSILPWIDRLQGKHLNGESYESLTSPFSGRVGAASFIVS